MVKVVKYEKAHLSSILSAAECELDKNELLKLKNNLNGLTQSQWALTCFSESGETIGYALGELLPRGEELITDIYVIPSQRRQGVGSVILVSAFYHATLRLSLKIKAVCEKNSIAARFFSARTFTAVTQQSENSANETSASETHEKVTFIKSLLPMYKKEN